MKKWMTVLGVSVGLLAGCSFGGSEPAQDVKLQLPVGYKKTGPYLVADRLGQEDQVIVLFANATARFGAQTDGKLPYDSVIVGEIYSAKKDADGNVVESQIGRRIPDELKTIVMMQRIAGADAKYPEELKVGDWEFAAFSPTGQNLDKDTTACRECHQPLGDAEFTWSYDHLTAAN